MGILQRAWNWLAGPEQFNYADEGTNLVGPDGHLIPPDQLGLMDKDGKFVPPAEFAIPHQYTFSSILQGAHDTYIANQFDEAMAHNRENAIAMRRDCRIMGWLRERKNNVVSLKWHLEVDNPKDPVQKAVCDGMTKIIKDTPRLNRVLTQLMEALWYGRYAVELVWDWDEMELPGLPAEGLFPLGNEREAALQRAITGGQELEMGEGGVAQVKTPTERRKVLRVRKSKPWNGDKINYLWDGTPLMAVYSTADLPGAKIIYDNEKPNIALVDEWRERFIIHQHDPDDADYFEAEKAGGIYGVGIRSRIYWLNWIRMEYAAWIQDTFDRMGLGFVIIKYDAGNVKAKEEAEKAAKKWNRKSVLTIPVSMDQLRQGGAVEVVEVPTSGALVVQSLIEYADKHLERYIVGQSMSAGESGREGLGGTAGPAEMAQSTQMKLIKADAHELAETLTGSADEPGLVSTTQRWSYPGTVGKFRVRWCFNIDDDDPLEKLNAVTAAAAIGVTFDEDEVRELTGLSKPEEGASIVGGVQQPTGGFPPEGGGEGEDDEEEGGDEPPGKPMNGKPINGNGQHDVEL